MFSPRAMAKGRRKLNLQLTSLLDMFTIILVFLMVSFQSEDMDFILNSELELPVSGAKSPFKPAVNIAITQEAVMVDGEEVMQLLEGGDVSEEQLALGSVEAIADAVRAAWEAENRDGDEENVVVIQADSHLPYHTIHLVMKSAAMSGFYRYRLVIEKE